GAMTSASTAPASISTTIAPPTVPSGLRRTICTHTSTYHGGALFAASSAGFARAFGSWGGLSEGGASPPPRSISKPGIEEGAREVDQEGEADDHRRDDQVHGLHSDDVGPA